MKKLLTIAIAAAAVVAVPLALAQNAGQSGAGRSRCKGGAPRAGHGGHEGQGPAGAAA
jgi:Ni/Co efflux regulator RcnB